MDQVSADVLLIIFSELKDDIASLRSCILVDKFWCQLAMFVLWKYFLFSPKFKNKETREKFYNTIAHFLPNDPEGPLSKNNITLPLNKFSKAPTFEYMLYFTRISSFMVSDMANFLINEEDHVYKQNILEEEIYKLIFDKCKNVNQFHFRTTKEICSYPNAKNFFSNLNNLKLSFEKVEKVENNIILNILCELTKICKCIEELDIGYIREESQDLALFIEDEEEEEIYPLLSYVVAEKAAKLKNFILASYATLIDPRFLTSSVKLQSLEINNDYSKINVNWKYWESCLDKASFPDLQYLVTSFLPSGIERLIIEKSGGNILQIEIRFPFNEFEDYPVQNNQLIVAISNKCPHLKKLTISIEPTNLIEINRIFSNCIQLEKINFTADVYDPKIDVVSTRKVVDPNGDELLRIISNVSPKTIRKFSFGYKWNFTIEGLESFFESWKRQKRFPIKFEGYWEMGSTWSNKHKELVAKYKDEGIITMSDKEILKHKYSFGGSENKLPFEYSRSLDYHGFYLCSHKMSSDDVQQ
ncbi:hypothetical protein C1646_668362 [Rhizophagus diaphanus]|nr:hypothetical protein C1646_668362 [Rhizophagus diaphanus] [Rhizophagus sp. MUCL 43196]